MENKIYTVPEVAEILKVGKKLIYELTQEGKLKFINIGKRKLIPEQCIKEFIENQLKN